MPFETTIRAFAAALGEPSAPPPAMTRGRMGAPDARRFAVYRNNVAVGLIGALEARYPVSRRIVGDDFFRAIARLYVSARRPTLPLMIAYGDDFPDFIAARISEVQTEPSLDYLPDVARLENAWVEAYHAEDAPVTTIDEIAALSADQLPETRIAFHPAAQLLRFATPAASIWASHQGDAEPAAPTDWIGEDALLTRPDCDVKVRILPPLGYEFALRLREGATLAEAAEAMDDLAFDLGTHLVGLVESGAVASIIPGQLS
jgi:Putative DNA-binding domain